MNTIMMTAQSKQIEQTRRDRERERGRERDRERARQRDSHEMGPQYAASASASRPNSKLNVCTFFSPLLSSHLLFSSPVFLPHRHCLSLSSAFRRPVWFFVAVASRRCDRMKYSPEGRYNFDAFTTFRVLVIIGSLCLEVSFMIAFLFSWSLLFCSSPCWLLCYVLLIVELVSLSGVFACFKVNCSWRQC